MQALNQVIINKTGVSQIVKLGNLNIKSGRICACDPLVESYFVPFETEVPNGSFPVELYLEEDTDLVGMAVVWFHKSNEELNWKMATVPGESISESEVEDGFILGFPVESGLACFIDPSFSKSFLEKEDAKPDAEDDINESPFIGPLLNENGGDWALASMNESENIAVFSSGYGEGNYACYFGYDANNNLVTVAMDLDVFFVDEE